MPINIIDKRNKAKEVIKAACGGNVELRYPDTIQYHKAAELALVYEKQLNIYHNNLAKGYLKNNALSPDDNNYEYFLKTAMLTDIASVSYEFYVRAQFYWFDKWFKKAPKPYHLCNNKSKYNSQERVRLYEQEINKGVKDTQIRGLEHSQ